MSTLEWLSLSGHLLYFHFYYFQKVEESTCHWGLPLGIWEIERLYHYCYWKSIWSWWLTVHKVITVFSWGAPWESHLHHEHTFWPWSSWLFHVLTIVVQNLYLKVLFSSQLRNMEESLGCHQLLSHLGHFPMLHRLVYLWLLSSLRVY